MTQDEIDEFNRQWFKFVHHQRMLTIYATLFTVTAFLAFVVSPWLFAQACLFVLLAAEHREERNLASDRCAGRRR